MVACLGTIKKCSFATTKTSHHYHLILQLAPVKLVEQVCHGIEQCMCRRA